jgi:hypothetical protein
MKKKLVAAMIMGFFMLCMVGKATAVIVNIDSVTHTRTTPNSVFFTAGTYEVTPIGVANGGTYNSWNNSYGTVNPPGGVGWLNGYRLSSNDFSEYPVTDGVIHTTELLALDNAVGTSFTLTSDGNVDFFIGDPSPIGNLGGISLDVNPASSSTKVPVHSGLWLIPSILGGLYLLRRRKVKSV